MTNVAGVPLAGICVSAYQANNIYFYPDLVVTDSAGNYSMNILPGDYKVYFEDCSHRAYASQWYGGTGDFGSAKTVHTDPLNPATGISAALQTLGQIAGTVTASGQAVAGICVDAFTPSGWGYSSARTDASGLYVLTGLDSGTYGVLFTDCRATPSFADQWYKAETDFEFADPVAATVGTTTSGIDASLTLAPPPPPALAPSNWALVKITAGSAGATEVVVWAQTDLIRDTSGGPMMMGWGIGDSARGGGVAVTPWGGGPAAITATNGIANLTVQPDSTQPGSAVGSMGARLVYPSLSPGQSVAVLFFTPGMTMSDFTSGVRGPKSGSTTVTVTSGTDARALLAADPADSGAAVAALGVAAGTSSHTAQVSRGLVGGFVWNFAFCNLCIGTWQPPGGTSHTWQSAGVLLGIGVSVMPDNNGTFLGPAGPWTWTWSGVGGEGASCFGPSSLPMAAYGAFAPIGDDWTLFAGRTPTIWGEICV